MTSNPIALKHTRTPQDCRGATLIEVLIAVVILAIGLLGYAALQSGSLQGSYSSYLRSQATWLAYDIVDQMRSHREDAIDGDYCSSRWDRDLWLARVPAVMGNGATGIIAQPWSSSVGAPTCTGSEQVEIRIQWNDARGNVAHEGATDSGDQANLQTFIFRTEL